MTCWRSVATPILYRVRNVGCVAAYIRAGLMFAVPTVCHGQTINLSATI